MRGVWSAVVLAGCGAVNLGTELGAPEAGVVTESPSDAGTPVDTIDTIDATDATETSAESNVLVEVRIGAEGGCDGCFDLSATASGGRAPYSFEWGDGPRGAERRVCSPTAEHTLSVVARDADGTASAAFTTRLDAPDASCPAPPEEPALCLQNPSFEGTPVANIGFQPMFDCGPWSDCTEDGSTNTPDVMDETIDQIVVSIPPAVEGKTFVGMMSGEQVSQSLCKGLPGGKSVSLELSVGRINVSAGVVPDTQSAFLEIWGGVAADCSARELLWASPSLDIGWKTVCVELTPQAYMDNLVLRSNSSDSLSAVGYVIVDNLRPVSQCP